MLFANATPPVEIAAWLACLAFVVVLANGVLKLVDRVKDKPAPGDVARETAEKFTRKDEFERHVAQNQKEHENIFSKIGGVERGAGSKVADEIRVLREERREDMAELKKHVDDIGSDTSALKATNIIQNQRLTSIETDIKVLLTRMPRA